MYIGIKTLLKAATNCDFTTFTIQEYLKKIALFEGCARIFANLFFKSKREHLRN